MILASIFYSLIIISDNNKCTSVRSYACKKTQVKSDTLINSWSIESTWAIWQKGWNMEENLGTLVTDETTIKDVKPSWDMFTKWLETEFKSITDNGDQYILDYAGKDNLRIYMAKDRSWVEKVIKNGISLSRQEINQAFWNK